MVGISILFEFHLFVDVFPRGCCAETVCVPESGIVLREFIEDLCSQRPIPERGSHASIKDVAVTSYLITSDSRFLAAGLGCGILAVDFSLRTSCLRLPGGWCLADNLWPRNHSF